MPKRLWSLMSSDVSYRQTYRPGRWDPVRPPVFPLLYPCHGQEKTGKAPETRS